MTAEDKGIVARAAAVDLVMGVTAEGVQISDLLARPGFLALAPENRARAQRLALSTLRHLAPAGTVLKPLLRKDPPPVVRTALLVATAEMLADGAAAHGVVSATVSGLRARGRAAEGYAGLANAVLRRVAATDPAAWARLPPQELPSWLRGRLMSAWGKAAVQAIERAHAAGAPLDLTPRDGDPEKLAASTGGEALATGNVRIGGSPQVSALPGYAEGAFWVQDAAAALAARMLAPRPGERVLDLCAAPGGKTLQLAAAGAQVTALDVSEPRLARLRENLARCRLQAAIVAADALEWQPEAPFDAILLDAPCSATGTIRRHPDLPFLRSRDDLRPLVELQSRLIDRAAAMLKPGGRLVFSTCSLLPEEGERQVSAALGRLPDLRPDPQPRALPGVEPGWFSGDCGLRTRPDFWPERGGLDGFFLAALRIGG